MRYLTPRTLDDAYAHLASGGVRIVAGGTDVFAASGPRDLTGPILDVTTVAGLRGITRADGQWRIGAATRWADLWKADLPPGFHGLQAAAREVGSLQIQNSGTVGGNLCNASPAADGVPPLLTLDARVEIGSLRGRRVVPLERFVTGVRETGLAADEMVTAVLLPDPPAGAVGRFEKLGARRYMVISIAMVAVLIGLGPDRRIARARVAVGACSAVAQRLSGLERAAIGARPDAVRVDPDHLSGLSPIADLRGSAEYRMEAVAELCARAIRAAGQADG
ncbi:MAG: FAD binding domain-containing protein [Marinibacterium sp.]|nr:FAD binding domain-containing protein [Marinibacterium sp.]